MSLIIIITDLFSNTFLDFFRPMRLCYKHILLCYACRGKVFDRHGKSSQAAMKSNKGCTKELKTNAGNTTSLTYVA